MDLRRFVIVFTFLSAALNCLIIAKTDEKQCGGNCLSESCPICLCGNATNIVDINTICNQTFWSQTSCHCIVRMISKGNANALDIGDNRIKVGLFGINSYDWISCNHGRPPCDPSANLYCAAQIYKASGNSWKEYWAEAALKCGSKT